MAGNELFEQFKDYLPKYLSPERQKDLFSELSLFPNDVNYYLNHTELADETLQGDSWRGFSLINFHLLQKKQVTGIIVSNTCDIAIENDRYLPVNILFAPILELSKYSDRLLQKGFSQQRLEQNLQDVRQQKLSNCFYMPEKRGFLAESVVLLDNINSHPRSDFLRAQPEKVLTLSQLGFYIFVIKLSIHLMRVNESVVRFNAA